MVRAATSQLFMARCFVLTNIQSRDQSRACQLPEAAASRGQEGQFATISLDVVKARGDNVLY